MEKRTLSASMRAYNALRRKKKALCAGKATKTEVKAMAAKYVTAAVKKGKNKAEATKVANRVLTAGCKMSSSISKPKKSTAKRRTSK